MFWCMLVTFSAVVKEKTHGIYEFVVYTCLSISINVHTRSTAPAVGGCVYRFMGHQTPTNPAWKQRLLGETLEFSGYTSICRISHE